MTLGHLVGILETAFAITRRFAETARFQSAALPWRVNAEGATEVLLVTNYGGRAWLLPKGNPTPGDRPSRSAAREAHEEAGVRGEVSAHPLGRYLHFKRLRNGRVRSILVSVFPLRVSEELPHWPEEDARGRRWMSVEAAASLVRPAGLRRLLLRFAEIRR